MNKLLAIIYAAVTTGTNLMSFHKHQTVSVYIMDIGRSPCCWRLKCPAWSTSNKCHITYVHYCFHCISASRFPWATERLSVAAVGLGVIMECCGVRVSIQDFCIYCGKLKLHSGSFDASQLERFVNETQPLILSFVYRVVCLYNDLESLCDNYTDLHQRG